ncbi:MAG: hypothetical protein FJX72_02880 [Armatimonadetes bacterium]|nr:hypothetical protein [Armatimonadota bacterium]
MPAVRINISLEPEVVAVLRRRSRRMQMPASRYIAALVQADAQRALDEAAEEGYRLLSSGAGAFAQAAAAIADETWPAWDVVPAEVHDA